MKPWPGHPADREPTRAIVSEGLRALGKRRLVLSIHDASYPGDADEDIGWGSPYTSAGHDFVRFAAGLGFTGLQFGPQGLTSRVNPSPYDGTIFSRSVLSIALGAFGPLSQHPLWGGLLDSRLLEEVVRGRPAGDSGRGRYLYAFDAQRRLLRQAFRCLRSHPREALEERLSAFSRQHAAWLDRDALFEALLLEHGDVHFAHWGPDGSLLDPPAREAQTAARRRTELEQRYGEEIALYRFCQFVAHAQQEELGALAGPLGLRLYGDLQVGLSLRDRWSYGGLFLPDYFMGAPPSRTNPAGQPWAYPVLDPARYHLPGGAPGAALQLLGVRVAKMLAEFDGLRVDHPHGLICPWVYRAAEPDPLHAVQHGARLFSSPDLPEHPELARLAIARPDQLDRGVLRHEDGWVRALEPEQVARYAAPFDAVVASLRAQGRELEDLLCEVLSTYPYPIRRVIERHGLGRFRVTQKADLRKQEDVYRSENAAPPDWIMVGNHDTPPIWRVVETWQAQGVIGDRAAYLAARLCRDPAGREALQRRLAADMGELVQAQFADLFVCPAQNVQIFFADLLGMREIYNVPGEVNDENWSLRVPLDYQQQYRRRLGQGAALNLPAALALALRARGEAEGADQGLLAALSGLAAQRH